LKVEIRVGLVVVDLQGTPLAPILDGVVDQVTENAPQSHLVALDFSQVGRQEIQVILEGDAMLLQVVPEFIQDRGHHVLPDVADVRFCITFLAQESMPQKPLQEGLQPIGFLAGVF
jgi:hypothetical protein